jgi:hypothetical protein
MSLIFNFWDDDVDFDGHSELGIGIVPGFPAKGQRLMAGSLDVSDFRTTTKYLLGYQASSKVEKSDRQTYIIYLAPASYSFTLAQLRTPDGKMVNTCPDASPECIATCLNISGRSMMELAAQRNLGFNIRTFGGLGNILQRRILRTALLYWYPELFYSKIEDELMRATRKFPSEKVAIRLNGTSDIDMVTQLVRKGTLNKLPSNFVFYDYTKDPMRVGVFRLPSGHMYVVTFSRSEINTPMALKMLEKGNVVAVVFRDQLPKKWFGYDVINGDLADDIMIDLAEGRYVEKVKVFTGKYEKKGKKSIKVYEKAPTGNVYNFRWGQQKGVVLGLSAKGYLKNYKSKKGAAGFVIDCDNYTDCRVG